MELKNLIICAVSTILLILSCYGLPIMENATTTEMPFFMATEINEVDFDLLFEEMDNFPPNEIDLNTEPCIFPFTVVSYFWYDNLTRSEYTNRTFYACAPSDWGINYKSWCATNETYFMGTLDRKYCEGPNRYCVFPFLYQGVNQTQCVEHEQEAGRYWCSLTPDYDTDGEREWCMCYDDATSPADCYYI